MIIKKERKTKKKVVFIEFIWKIRKGCGQVVDTGQAVDSGGQPS